MVVPGYPTPPLDKMPESTRRAVRPNRQRPLDTAFHSRHRKMNPEERMKNEIGDVKPTSIKHLIGQRGVLDQVAVALDAAFADDKKFDHALLVGPPGLGKSQTAFVIAQEMAHGFHEVLGQSIACPADLNALLLGANERDVDPYRRVHTNLTKEYQTTLYLALDQRKLTLGGGRTGKSVQSVPLADFTLLLSTTDEYGLVAAAPGPDEVAAAVRLLLGRRSCPARAAAGDRPRLEGSTTPFCR